MTLLAILAALIVSWQYQDGASVRIERRATAGYVALHDAPPSVLEFADGSVVAGTTYCYRAFAYTSTQVSNYSNEACAIAPTETTEPPPPPPCRQRGKSGKCK
jgi:hypothetical protein